MLEDHMSYEFYNVPRDQAQFERLMTTFELDNPIERVVYSKERRINIVFQFAEFLWYMSGSNDLDYISYYAKNMRKYSSDGKTLTGTAYGKKIFRDLPNGRSQIDTVVEMLRKTPDTKRAVIQIYDSDEIADFNNIDVSCTLALQFLLRNGALNCVAFMRANDMFVGMSSDVFSFTMLQEYMARQLNVPVGKYYHVVGSSHIYECNFLKAKEVLATKKPFSTYNLSFPKMPSKNLEDDLQIVLNIEHQLRHNNISLDEDKISQMSINEYWKDVLRLLELKREHEYETSINSKILSALHVTLQYLYSNRFGE